MSNDAKNYDGKKTKTFIKIKLGSVRPCYALIPNIAIIFDKNSNRRFDQYGLHFEWLGCFMIFIFIKCTPIFEELYHADRSNK